VKPRPELAGFLSWITQRGTRCHTCMELADPTGRGLLTSR
jgi:hypothetical protein